MLLSEIRIPVNRIKGAGRAAEARLAVLGIRTVGELLAYWPRAWEDRTEFHTLRESASHGKIQLKCRVTGHSWFGYGRMRTLKLRVEDEEHTHASLLCFNRPFLETAFPPGSMCVVFGSFAQKYGELQSSNFEIEHAGGEIPKAKILPIYPLTEGLTQGKMRKWISAALREYAKGITSALPEAVRRAHNIPAKQDVLFSMHTPKTMEETGQARRAVIFEEFFFFAYALGLRALKRRGRLPARSVSGSSAETSAPSAALPFRPLPAQQAVLDRLPFRLTPGQQQAAAEINADLASSSAPMARLLQGDVGSGKTLVAFLAAANICNGNRQCALIVPTELLARQHAETAAKILEPVGIRIAFLSGSTKAVGKDLLRKELQEGNIDFIVGTHALFSRELRYRNLSLVIVDEQHRFGVLQRAAMLEKGRESSPEGKTPHLLLMSATPIPRTLSLSVFGDLDISTIHGSPPGRKPVQTHLTRKGNEKNVYDFVRREIAAGRQAYFVYPVIGADGGADLKSAEQMYKNLRHNIFPDTRIALLHSRIPEEEQREIMRRFQAGEIKILTATSVIEVGVDIPNATCMVIEHAERFGLAALHQLRGRVGRGEFPSHCFLIYGEKLTEDGKARLKIMKETTDGFRIAEEDLKIRGPGEISGTQQSGYTCFQNGDPVRDADILLEAREAAFSILEKGNLPQLLPVRPDGGQAT